MSRIWAIARKIEDRDKRHLKRQSVNRAEVSDLFRIMGFLAIYWLVVAVAAAGWFFRGPILAWWTR